MSFVPVRPDTKRPDALVDPGGRTCTVCEQHSVELVGHLRTNADCCSKHGIHMTIIVLCLKGFTFMVDVCMKMFLWECVWEEWSGIDSCAISLHTSSSIMDFFCHIIHLVVCLSDVQTRVRVEWGPADSSRWVWSLCSTCLQMSCGNDLTG